MVYGLILSVVRFLMSMIYDRNEEAETHKDTVYIKKILYSRVYLGVSIVFGCICIFINSLPNEETGRVFVSSIMIAVSVICFIFSIMYKKWYIRLEKNTIVYQNMIGKKIVIDLNTVTHYKINEHGEVFLYNKDNLLLKISTLEKRKYLIDLLKDKHIMEKRDKTSREFTIKVEPVQKWTLVILTIGLIVIGILCVKVKYILGIWASIIIILLSIGVCLDMFLRKIVFSETEVYEYRFMRKPKKIEFCDIERVEVKKIDNAECYCFYAKNNKKLKVNMAYLNTHLLKQLVEKKGWISTK